MHMEFPPRFKFPDALMTPTLIQKIKNKVVPPPVFYLRGLVEHQGRSTNSGHYTATIRHGKH